MWQRARKIGLWSLTVLLALSFVPTGLGKLTDEGWREAFAAWGYPPGFVYLVAVVEIVAGVLLLVPRLTALAAGTLGALMVGALLTHAVHGNHPTFPAAQMAMAYLVIAAFLARARWGISVLGRGRPAS